MLLLTKQTVQGSSLCQIFQCRLVHYRTINSSAEIKKISVIAISHTLMHYGLCRLFATPFNGRKTK